MRLTLLSDGSSDRALIPSLNWALRENGVNENIQGMWADFSYRLVPPVGLRARILTAIDLYPSELLFVHRDAEAVSHSVRKQEIEDVVSELREENSIQVPTVCVVPVRMQEAWLLISETAIRRAAGNPRGHMALGIPRHNRLESTPDPKNVLFQALRTASGQTGRRLAKLHLPSLRHRVAELITDYSGLRSLPAFRALEADLVELLPSLT